MSDQLLTYDQVAARIERVLGVRPAVSTLRKEHSTNARTSHRNLSKARIATGLPAPIAESPGMPSLFSAQAIDKWLADHPQTAAKSIRRALMASTSRTRARAIERAREAGMSWEMIAEALTEADGSPITRQALYKRYGP